MRRTLGAQSLGNASNPLLTSDWWADPDFWDAVYPVLFGPARFEEAEDRLSNLTERLRVKPPQIVLDVSCGPGRYAVALAKAGFRVLGYDPHAGYVAEALERAAAAGVSERVAAFSTPQAVQRWVTEHGSSGIAAGIWVDTSYGYAGSVADLRTLSWIRGLLQPGASLLVEGLTSDGLEEADWGEPEWDCEPGDQDGCAAMWRLVRRVTMQEEAAWLEADWTRFENGNVREFPYRHRLYSSSELRKLIKAAGFTKVLFDNEMTERASSTFVASGR